MSRTQTIQRLGRELERNVPPGARATHRQASAPVRPPIASRQPRCVRVRVRGGGETRLSVPLAEIAQDPGLALVTGGIAGPPVVGAIAGGDPPAAPALLKDVDVVLVDRDCPHPDPLALVQRLKGVDRPPGVLVHRAGADPLVTVEAIVAGADGVVYGDDPAGSLCDAVRWVAGARRWMPEVPLPVLSQVASAIERGDVRILWMLLRGHSAAQIGEALGIGRRALAGRRWGMLQRIRVDAPLRPRALRGGRTVIRVDAPLRPRAPRGGGSGSPLRERTAPVTALALAAW